MAEISIAIVNPEWNFLDGHVRLDELLRNQGFDQLAGCFVYGFVDGVQVSSRAPSPAVQIIPFPVHECGAPISRAGGRITE